MKPRGVAYIQSLIQKSKQLTSSYEVILLTNNENWTKNIADYAGYSVKTEFFSEADESNILHSLQRVGFSVRQFFNEEDFIDFVSNAHQDLSKIIVINSAQKGTKIGRKSLIPAVCDLYGISYTGSNPYVVSLCRDKYRCGCILAQSGIPVPNAWIYQPVTGWFCETPTAGKLIVKPNYEAASIGIDASNICSETTVLKKAHQMQTEYQQEIIVEEFIPGYEVEVPVIISDGIPMAFIPAGISLNNNKKMGEQILDYNLRRADAYNYYNFSEEFPELSGAALDIAVKTAQILNIQGFGRVDFRISESGNIYVTDIATNPHYTTGSSYEFLFNQMGFTYDDLIACLVSTAIKEIDL